MLAVYYIYDLPFFKEQSGLVSNLLGGWQVSGASFFRTGTPFSILQTSQDVAGVGDVSVGQPWDLVGDPKAGANEQFSAGSSRPELLVQSRGVRSSRRPGRSATRRATCSTIPASSSGTSRCSRTSAWAARVSCRSAAEFFNFPNHPNLGNPSGNVSAQTGTVNSSPVADPDQRRNFGRVTTKSGQRDIQLSVRFQF